MEYSESRTPAVRMKLNIPAQVATVLGLTHVQLSSMCVKAIYLQVASCNLISVRSNTKALSEKHSHSLAQPHLAQFAPLSGLKLAAQYHTAPHNKMESLPFIVLSRNILELIYVMVLAWLARVELLKLESVLHLRRKFRIIYVIIWVFDIVTKMVIFT